jgi:hypothetical protein
MHDTLALAFGAAVLLVMAGLYLVNKPSPVVPVPHGSIAECHQNLIFETP